MEISENGDSRMPFKTSALSVRGLRFHYSSQFNFEDSLNLSPLYSRDDRAALSSSNSIIIMRDKKKPRRAFTCSLSHIGWFIITHRLSCAHLSSASRALSEKYSVIKAILDIIQKDEKFRRCLETVWDITREINHKNALCCTQRRSEKSPHERRRCKKISQHS